MALLPEMISQKIWRGLMRFWSSSFLQTAFSKSELYAAVTAIDTFLDNNAVAINNAFPLAFRTDASVGQKAAIVAVVALARYNPNLLQQLIGEVD